MYHSIQNIDLVIREKYLSTYEFILSNQQDVDNVSLRESLLCGCNPILIDIGFYSNIPGYKLNKSNKNIHPIEIINYLKNNNPFKIDITSHNNLFYKWDKIAQLYLE
jgi:hypothetical protein